MSGLFREGGSLSTSGIVLTTKDGIAGPEFAHEFWNLAEPLREPEAVIRPWKGQSYDAEEILIW